MLHRSSILDVYEKYKHLDDLFSDREFMDGSPLSSIVYDLWKAIKDDQLVVLPVKVEELESDDIEEKLVEEW